LRKDVKGSHLWIALLLKIFNFFLDRLRARCYKVKLKEFNERRWDAIIILGETCLCEFPKLKRRR
jgi:hypothetical protein